MITSLTELRPDTRAAAEAWLAASGGAVEDADLRADVVDELTSALLAGLDAAATPGDLASLVDRIGPLDAEPAAEGDPAASGPGPHGSIGGVPYDLRPPTADRIRATWWNPAEPRIFVPRVFGIGWALNFGALAVRLGLIEPDAEDVPFASTPPAALRTALALPVFLTAATVLHYAVRGRSLPERLPSHWDAAGRPDRWTSKTAAAVTDLAVTVVPTAVAVAAATTGRTPQSQAGVLAAAAMATAAGAGSAVWRSAGDRPRWWAGPAFAAAMLGAPGGTLLYLALAGRNAERRRDLAASR